MKRLQNISWNHALNQMGSCCWCCKKLLFWKPTELLQSVSRIAFSLTALRWPQFNTTKPFCHIVIPLNSPKNILTNWVKFVGSCGKFVFFFSTVNYVLQIICLFQAVSERLRKIIDWCKMKSYGRVSIKAILVNNNCVSPLCRDKTRRNFPSV